MERMWEGMTGNYLLRVVEALVDDESMIRGVTEEERSFIGLIRRKRDQRVTALVRNGHIVQADVDVELIKPKDGFTGERLIAVLEGEEFATLTIGKRAGRIAHATLVTPIKVRRDTGRTRLLPSGDVKC